MADSRQPTENPLFKRVSILISVSCLQLAFFCSFLFFGNSSFLGFVCKSLAAFFGSSSASFEAVDAAFGVDNLFFTGEEWVRSARNVHFHKRVFVAVFPFDSFVAGRGALRQKRELRCLVLENDEAVVGWMYIFFHSQGKIISVLPLKVKVFLEECEEYTMSIMNKKPVGDEQIKAFLDLFDGDDEKAAAALNAYRTRRKKKAIVRDTPLVVRFEGVTKTYKMGKQSVHALAEVDLEIHEGEFVVITGASGSGKSTLLQLMGALDQPTSGVVTVAGKNLRKTRDGKLAEFRAQTIGFVFQFFFLQPFLRLERNLEVPGMFARMPGKERRERTRELAQKVGLSERLRHFPKELSGGQMQRAAIARALLNSPKLLLADEPTGNLDSENGKAIIDLFEAIRNELGTTVVVVTHDAGIAARADRVITMKDGEIVA